MKVSEFQKQLDEAKEKADGEDPPIIFQGAGGMRFNIYSFKEIWYEKIESEDDIYYSRINGAEVGDEFIIVKTWA